jgi:hypothetical protein
MYAVVFKSSRVVAARFNDRASARFWLECNDYDQETGECLNLFTIERIK